MQRETRRIHLCDTTSWFRLLSNIWHLCHSWNGWTVLHIAFVELFSSVFQWALKWALKWGLFWDRNSSAATLSHHSEVIFVTTLGSEVMPPEWGPALGQEKIKKVPTNIFILLWRFLCLWSVSLLTNGKLKQPVKLNSSRRNEKDHAGARSQEVTSAFTTGWHGDVPYIWKAGFSGFQNQQIILNFPQKDCLRMQKPSSFGEGSKNRQRKKANKC